MILNDLLLRRRVSSIPVTGGFVRVMAQCSRAMLYKEVIAYGSVYLFRSPERISDGLHRAEM